MRPFVAVTLTLALAVSLAAPASAAWPNSPFNNLPLCTVAGSQQSPAVVSDGAGGAIVTWFDYRGGHADIYAQHVLASGAVDPSWPAGGRALCTVVDEQLYPTIVSDGAGGAVVAWYDARNGGVADIYAQRVLASGVVDPAWPINGRALCVAVGEQLSPTLVSDGAGGAIVTWYDFRSGAHYDIYAQRVLASGAVDAGWPADGRALCTAANHQFDPTIVSDGAGGAIVTWQDRRSGTQYDTYAQRVLVSGAVDPAWPADGRALCTAAGDQAIPTIVSDGAGGAIVTWHDYRGGANSDIYAQHVLASGAVDGAWPVNGRALCTAVNNQTGPTLVSDGGGGAIVTWYDYRGGNADIYAHHVQASGVADPGWPADGRAVCTATGDQLLAKIASDGAGGALVTWHDNRSGAGNDVYAHHVLASGAVDGVWPANGRALCLAANSQSATAIVWDGAGGAIVTWQDSRSGAFDLYAQRVEAFGRLGNPEPVIASVQDVPYDDGGHVKVSWAASYLDAMPYNEIASYEVWRSIPPAAASAALRSGTRLLRMGEARDATAARSIRVTVDATQTIYWEYVGSQAARRFAGYSYHLATTGDSIAAGIPVIQVMILAIDTDDYSLWASAPGAGYSVDNLAPAAPAPLLGQFSGGTTSLHWGPNSEADLAGYRLYRGTTGSFLPGPGNLVAALSDTGYADASGTPHYYKLTAVDVHGNESPVATLSPAGTVAVGGTAPPGPLAFAAPGPNPARTATTLRYALPRASRVRLAIYDAAGRLVRELANGGREAGDHAEAWDLRGAGGEAVGAGLYFARLEAEGLALVRRVAVTR